MLQLYDVRVLKLRKAGRLVRLQLSTLLYISCVVAFTQDEVSGKLLSTVYAEAVRHEIGCPFAMRPTVFENRYTLVMCQGS